MRKLKKKVREIGPKDMGVAGYFFSKKDENSKQFESLLERDYIYHLEFDNNVLCYIEQPLTIEYVEHNGRIRNYIPDFFVRFKDSQKNDLIVEIKYQDDLNTNYLILLPKFEAAEAYCEKKSLTFSVLTDKHIRKDNPDYLYNIKFLYRYRDSLDDPNRSSEEIQEDIKITMSIINIIRSCRKCTINELIAKVSHMRDRDTLLFYVWYMLSNNYLTCNLEIKLSLNTEIWIT